MIVFRLNLISLNIIAPEIFHQLLSSLINYVTRCALRHFLPRYSNRTFRPCLSLFMNPNRGLRIHARATYRGKRRRKCTRAREKGNRAVAIEEEEEKEDGKRRASCRVKERKSLQPVSERPVPGQSIKNVSRIEIIKVRISGTGREGSDERRGKEMYDARTKKGGDREWVG